MFNKKNIMIMNDSGFGKFLVGLLSGAAVGAVLGILYAPDKGDRTRRKIAKTSRDIRNGIKDKIQDFVDSAEEFVEDLRDEATDLLNKEVDVDIEVEQKNKTKRAK
jgi:gas vesicle protein